MEDPVTQWNVGDAVWYDAGGLGVLFKATIASPRPTEKRWSLVLTGLPAEYREYVGRSVATNQVPLDGVYGRNPGDERNYITWDQYVEDYGLASGKMKHVAQRAEEDTSRR